MLKKEIKPSHSFKKQIFTAVFSLVLFVLVYVTLLTLAVAFTALCIYSGITIIVHLPKFWIVVLGAGISSLGILVLVFLIKFIYKSHKIDRSHLVQIKGNDEPELFAFIKKVVQETNTTFPKKVYLSADVNASVFYNSNFWSMFLPTRKNLVIGLGLVNSITKTELKAILSHEFGHFSQKSMKVGSYVYYVNQVIYNMIYENDSYDSIIRKWASISSIFMFFVQLASYIIHGIQWILSKLYEIVNTNYLALSREMEFHADEVAASITGLEPLRNSLLRMPLSEHAYNAVLSFYESRIDENERSGNIFLEQRFVMNFLAGQNDISVVQELPHVPQNKLNTYKKSKLNVEDQWASHPSTEDRIQNLTNKGLSAKQTESSSANSVFKNALEVQEKLTQWLFRNVNFEQSTATKSLKSFQEAFVEEYRLNSFSKIYNGYYDDKNPIWFDINSVHSDSVNETWENLFSQEKVDLIYESLVLENDIEGLKRIAYGSVAVKHFDYEGQKYKAKEANNVLLKLIPHHKQKQSEIRQNDISIFQYFLELEGRNGHSPKLRSLYSYLFSFEKTLESKYETYNKLSEELEFINEITPYEVIQKNLIRIKELEGVFKIELKELIQEGHYQNEISHGQKNKLETYLSEDLVYFKDEKYCNENLEVFFYALQSYAYLLSRGYFLHKKQLLDYQEKLQLRETQIHF